MTRQLIELLPQNRISLNELHFLISNNLIIEGVKGGLIIGPSHLEGGISIIMNDSKNDFYTILEVEGWEYLLNPFSTDKNLEELENINSEYSERLNEFYEYTLPENISILNCTPKTINGKFFKPVIPFGRNAQMIINKVSTQRYLDKIDKINSEFIQN